MAKHTNGFLLFAGDTHYPEGGAEDLQRQFGTMDEAMAAHDPQKYKYNGGWAHVLCLDSLKIVKIFSNNEWRDK